MSKHAAAPTNHVAAERQRTRTPLWIALALIALLLVGGAVWWWLQYMRPSFANGVTTVESVNAESGVVLALTAEDGVALSLLATDGKGSVARWEVSESGHQTKPVDEAPPFDELLTQPGAGCLALTANCPPANSSITIDGLGAMTWQAADARWTSEYGPAFDATLIYGRVDDLVIGNRTEAHLAGSVDTSQIPVDSITAFDIKTGDVVWTKYFDHPSIVALGTKHIWAAESPLSWSDLQGGDDAEATFAALVDTAERAPAVLRLGPASKANNEAFADAPEKAMLAAASAETSAPTASPTPSATPSPTSTPEPTPSETKPAVAPDAIKAFDIRNGYLPRKFDTTEQCGGREIEFWQIGGDRIEPSAFHKLPDAPDPCLWLDMVDGDSTAQMSYIDVPEGSIMEIDYADMNGDGYLDALVRGPFWDAGGYFAVIFDPQDPAHPYMAFLYGSQYQAGKLNGAGMLEMWFSDCIEVRIGLSGMPPQVTTFLAPDGSLQVGEQCLE